MWNYHNPVRIRFGVDSFDSLPELIGERSYALVTYDEDMFRDLAGRLAKKAGAAAILINNIRPNPDFISLRESCGQLAEMRGGVDVIVAIGGGSVIDAAKVLAFGPDGFDVVQDYLENPGAPHAQPPPALPLIAVPTTAGTGSEVTSWATVWDTESSKKYSLARSDLYPLNALVDPRLMAGMPRELTISTGLDALSHALESLWNVNANPISTNFAVAAARDILGHFETLTGHLDSIERRAHMARASMMAGMAFSNTKTALAHSLSYPITLHHGIAHGFACSFSLPMVMRSAIGLNEACDSALRAIFGPDLEAGAERLAALLTSLGVSTAFGDYGISRNEWDAWVLDAMNGERGRNFIGSSERVRNELLSA